MSFDIAREPTRKRRCKQRIAAVVRLHLERQQNQAEGIVLEGGFKTLGADLERSDGAVSDQAVGIIGGQVVQGVFSKDYSFNVTLRCAQIVGGEVGQIITGINRGSGNGADKASLDFQSGYIAVRELIVDAVKLSVTAQIGAGQKEVVYRIGVDLDLADV